MKTEICEICGSENFWQYDYPLDIKPFVSRVRRSVIRRYFVNFAKFIFRIFIRILPGIFSNDFKKRAFDSYKKIQSFKEAEGSLVGIKRGMKLFEEVKIFICKNCETGIVFPRIPEEKLMDHYKKDYWLSAGGEIEPAENRRTMATYELLSKYISFRELDEVLEFGSASAQLSRYFKSKNPDIIFDSVDPGLAWRDVLSGQLRMIYTDLKVIKTPYSLIMSSHALEHVPNLEEYFEKFISLLKVGGYLYFEVPNSEERDLIFGSNPDFHFPHTYFFTQKSFNQIAKKFGLEVVFNKTFSRSYSQIFSKTNKDVSSAEENPQGAYLRILLRRSK